MFATSRKRQATSQWRWLKQCCGLSPLASRLSRLFGFSLIELVISLAILSVGLIGAMRVFPLGLRASQRSELRTRATIVGQRTIESLKLTPWDQLQEGETTNHEDGFDVTTRIRQPHVANLADPTRLKLIEVSVGWTQDGQPRQQTFVTYVRRNTSSTSQ